jgi:hypothetical protein
MVVTFFWVKNWQTLAALWAGTLSCNKTKSGEQKSSFRIKNYSPRDVQRFAIILDVIRQSFLTKPAATAAMFTSV